MDGSGPSVANREEAEKCAHIAEEALNRGDLAKATKFLDKSMRLYPNKLAADLISQLQSHSQSGSSANHHTHTNSNSNSSSHSNYSQSNSHSSRSRSPPPPPPPPHKEKPSASANESKPQQRHNHTSHSNNNHTHNNHVEGVDYTIEQREAAIEIKKSKNHYQTLGIPKQSTEKEIKAAYRKLALKFHPDKNKAPEAEEAFKMVSSAFQTLSDPQRKRHYDDYGEDEQATAQRQAAAYNSHRSREEDISPEDIFNMFFSQGMGQGGQHFYGRRVYRQHRRYDEGNQANANGNGPGPIGGLSQLAHFLPLLLLLLFSFISLPSSSDDIPFTFEKSVNSPNRRETSKSTEYFVGPNFHSRYARDPRSLSHVEQMVEQHAYKRAEEECIKQKQEKSKLMNEAKKSNNPDKLDKAQNIVLTACEKQRQLAQNLQ